MIAIDPNAAGLYHGFRRAHKANLSNAIFVVASAEALPEALKGSADEVRVQFPWGSLLDAVVRGDRAVLAGIAGLLRPGGRFRLLVSVVQRDHICDMVRLDDRRAAEIASRIAAVGLIPEVCREAGPPEIDAAESKWAKRLGAGRSRPAWLLQFRNGPTGAGTWSGTIRRK